MIKYLTIRLLTDIRVTEPGLQACHFFLLKFYCSMHKRSVFLLFALTFFLNVNAQKYKSLPAEYGLSALYPGDLGIENDSACVFYENFESSLTLEKWDQEWANAGTGKILQSAEKAHSGMNSYQAEMIRPNKIPSSIGIRKF